jgi:hypothetical protein
MGSSDSKIIGKFQGNPDEMKKRSPTQMKIYKQM